MKKILLSTVAVAALAISSNAQAYIPNSGFETWGSTAGEDQQPQYWISYNVFTVSFLDPFNLNPTSVTAAGSPDNYQGNYSARIETITLGDNPDSTTIPSTAGALFTGSVAFTTPYMFPGYASQQRPQTMNYYAKYTPVAGDSAFAFVWITRWNGAGRDTIAAGYDFMTGTTTSYALRTLTLFYNPAHTNTIPDSINIMFSASNMYVPQAGSVLFVDDVTFTGYVGVDEMEQNNGVAVYPNPSATLTQFDVTIDNAAQVIVYDMTGREVGRENFNGKVARVNSAGLADGAYTYSIITTEEEIVARGQFSVAH